MRSLIHYDPWVIHYDPWVIHYDPWVIHYDPWVIRVRVIYVVSLSLALGRSHLYFSAHDPVRYAGGGPSLSMIGFGRYPSKHRFQGGL